MCFVHPHTLPAVIFIYMQVRTHKYMFVFTSPAHCEPSLSFSGILLYSCDSHFTPTYRHYIYTFS